MDNMIIVGAAGGIGELLAHEYSGMYRLILVRHKSPLATSLTCKYPPMFIQADISDMSDCNTAANDIHKYTEGEIVLINASGVNINGIGHKMPSEDWQKVINVNLTGAFNICRAILPIMRERGWGRIINLSSVVGHKGIPGTCAYATSKAGLEALTRVLAVENATKRITVNALCIGYMNTGMINTIPADIQEKIKAKIPIGQFGSHRNIISAVDFLIDADYVTGSIITIDGGVQCA